MKNYLLFEIGVEELPARYVNSAMEQLKLNIVKSFDENRITYDNVNVYSTPRRLTVVVDNICERQEDLEEEVKGPAKKIAVDADGNFTKPLLGFMKSKGIKEEDLYFKQVGKEEYAFGKIKQEGNLTSEVLKTVLPEAIKSMTFPKAMRWGGKNMRFIRPIRWMVCILNDSVLDIELEGIVSGNITKGHRFLGESEFEVNTLDEYLAKLKENFVILNQDERKSIIKEQCEEVAKSLGGEIELDEELLEEVTHLVEYPTAFYGEFDEDYAKLPKEVVITPMKQHQRYFPVLKDGKLLPNFIAVRNGDSHRIDNVKAGNEKVLEARLADALFFYKEDTKKSLESYIEKLKTVVFQAKLGTVYNKTLRIEKLANDILEKLNESGVKEDTIRAAKLCKADLVTGMVFEFTELQGVMGREYAKVSGENENVAEAIFEHYLPRFAGDILPKTKSGIVLSIADKLDSIAGFFAIGIQPTGSQDPYALRRQALGIINILMDNNLDISLKELVDLTLDNYSFIEFNKEEVLNQIMDFFKDRIKNLFRDLGIRYDVIDAILSSNIDDIADMYARANALNSWIDKDELVEMLTAFNRVATLAQKAETDKVDINLMREEAEFNLYQQFQEIRSNVEHLLADKEYTKALDAFASLRPAIDNMFDSVMIMDKDEAIKDNRLAILKQIYDIMLNICDLSKIVYK
ncbi:glycine--tRNA ligase subunit beta [Paraclostridium sordellii]|uniref:Glycine--tRNA ligase beta subunit n=1 Tax=Paraclostridium sordellii TaxID=1505 RepID=A0A0C7I0R6_PARSO|nr:glycine--tRNA ligase subunit beta [Paeniclostridium sordellii]CEN79539.1 glycyl-tRNA ligase subunit beta [[Clostridium] sordellii] [Paeniclostridium sordellii]CEO05685.1 glycyl-tRNA ligase subunit beta [[Clostridium] sordellii] [Paeniclostridium sordellii]CEP86169.1 glycyl-tRNA ligase subunit beta [[Clostridium] sordellii] [Paeniclostridium sordellii]CEP96421.1 glycyl-tRNA ligase subunit beta [[Clostridium] sordellii] [Paeniclostridium sordellii]CEQ00113.1 glycyl-tRNA ligase subunit beta [[